MSYDNPLKLLRNWSRSYLILCAAFAVFQFQWRDSHPEWRCIVGLEQNDPKHLDGI